ncbi:zinc ABC transporter substrate-binding protein AdcA [Streptococcus mutans]|uniref:zinc ABC transporter substrate-binding protein AdcA n=1 Tax=Streptococcus mutans TaxID=1309 RepID=UPI001CFCFE47|nr:ZinT/AdcA family metal-binding protein [Streptococcus mutans]MCB4993423.1 zinc ABC transporter substrate-binding protein AdcA [Streptococcus mutans]MDT9516145.1 zinc ABC transporter substrate-binding protein AdcA [Streptococcus mutans]MDT9518247.1 zinc ABC transporter substrate-binding protein AdcA [Streptococcus mutans]MDT9554251.1 zinc ABC transporter substrate-binding protein AdcA [Streptococcus mutans]MDT9574921.1 zinc ABC transporter substrate-binding protein AdcA [Streptococcus mutans
MRKKPFIIVSLLLVILVVVIAFLLAKDGEKRSNGKLNVVTTFYPMYEFTKNVVGDQGKVSLLIKAGTEVHDFEPSTKDVTRIQEADTFVYDSDSMETWVKSVKKSVDTQKVPFVKATGNMILAPGVTEEEGHGHKGHHHAYDPHVWLSPKRAIKLVENIRDALSKKFPRRAKIFKKNAANYIDKLQTLDKEYAEGLANAKQKSFVTQHAAFGYLALDYGLTQIPITGLTAESEPSAKRLAELSKYVKEYGINYIYFEENASSAVSKTLADEAGVKTAVLSPLESLTQKQMDAGENYFSVMRANLKALKKTTDSAGKEIKPETDSDKTVANGYFKDKSIKNRKLSDWSGKWQSIYPYLENGTLDSVWDYKAKSKKDMTAQEYKEYYTKGYKTDVEKITIDGKKNTITFVQKGKEHKYTYKYVGYKILTYKKGNRGVRYLFETKDKGAGEFKYVQFSDHGIKSQKAEHFHLFWGSESQDKLLEEMENWPTYYPANLTGQQIAQEIVAH